MKKKFLRLFLCITLMLGFVVTLTSCHKDNETNPTEEKENEKDPVNPTPDPAPVDPTPTPTPTPAPVDPVDPTPTPEPEPSNILETLPENHYAKLFADNNFVTVNFKDFKVKANDTEYMVDNASFVKVTYDETLKANGLLKLKVNQKDVNTVGTIYFTFDGEEFIARIISTGELTFVNPKPEATYKEYDEMDNQKVFYMNMNAEKDKLFEAINEVMKSLDPDFDINEIDSLDDVKELVNITDDSIQTTSTKINTVVETILALFLKPTFAENQITLSLNFDILSLANMFANSITVGTLVDMLLGTGAFDKFVEITSNYVKVDKTKAPTPGITYYTYNNGVYTEANVTEWAPDTDYYYDNKTLGEYTIDDLIKYNAEDEGLITIDQIDLAMEMIETLVNTIINFVPLDDLEGSPSMLNMFKSEDGLEINESSIIMPLLMFLVAMDQETFVSIMSDPLALYKPVTGLTKWRKGAAYYLYDDLFELVENPTSFVEGNVYFVKHENVYVKVDTKTETFDPTETYYIFNPKNPVVTTRVKTPDSNVTYYELIENWNYDEEGSVAVTIFDKETTYYRLAYIPLVNLTEFDENEVYFVLDSETNCYVSIDTDEVENPVSGTVYYVETFVEVDKDVEPKPNEGERYFDVDNNQILTEFIEGFKYFIKDDTTDEYTEAEKIENGVTYYVGYSSNSYEVKEDLEAFDAKKEYATATTEYEYDKAEGLTAFAEDTTYYTHDEATDTYTPVAASAEFDAEETYYKRSESTIYTPVDIFELSEPDAEETYYTSLDKISDLLSLEPIKKVNVNYLATMIYRVVSSKQIAEQYEVGSEDYNTAVASLSNVNIDIAEMVNQYVSDLKNTKVYDLIAKALDNFDPIYEATTVEEWNPKTDYFTYNATTKKYEGVNTELVPTPVNGTTYYVINERAADDVKELIDELIETLGENITLNIISDNNSKLQKVEFTLDFETVSGTIELDFVTTYTDTISDELDDYVKYAEASDDKSTKLFEEILTDDVFEGYSEDDTTYELIKDNSGKFIGIKETTRDETTNYYFGENQTKDDNFESSKEYFDENLIRYNVTLKAENNKFDAKCFIYDLTKSKFVYDDDFFTDEYFYYDYAEEDYVLYYTDGETHNYYFDNRTNVLMINIETVDKTQDPVPGTKYYYMDAQYNICSTNELEEWEDNVTYYTLKEITGDATHPLVMKVANKTTGQAKYYVYYFAVAA